MITLLFAHCTIYDHMTEITIILYLKHMTTHD